MSTPNPPQPSPRKKPPVDRHIVGACLASYEDSLADGCTHYFVRETADDTDLVKGLWPAKVTVQWPGDGLNVAWITGLWVPYHYRGQGLAAAVLSLIVERIHERHMHAALAAQPFDPDEGQRFTMQALVDWYKRQGFEQMEAGSPVMVWRCA